MGFLAYGYFHKIPFSAYLFAAPFLRMMDGEKAHRAAIFFAARSSLLRWLLGMKDKSYYPSLETKVWGMSFETPIGLAAGFDKHAEAIDGLLEMGFGFVEIGSVTPEPQDGNP